LPTLMLSDFIAASIASSGISLSVLSFPAHILVEMSILR